MKKSVFQIIIVCAYSFCFLFSCGSWEADNKPYFFDLNSSDAKIKISKQKCDSRFIYDVRIYDEKCTFFNRGLFQNGSKVYFQVDPKSCDLELLFDLDSLSANTQFKGPVFIIHNYSFDAERRGWDPHFVYLLVNGSDCNTQVFLVFSPEKKKIVDLVFGDSFPSL